MTQPQDRRKPVLTRAEIAPDAAIRKAAETHGAETLIKVRVADALDLDDGDLDHELVRYGLMAHFDFLVGEGPERMPQFAVEFDDRSHERAVVRARDDKKNRLCELLGLPLLRIDRSRKATIAESVTSHRGGPNVSGVARRISPSSSRAKRTDKNETVVGHPAQHLGWPVEPSQ